MLKQVIVVRTDLDLGKGKMAAQVAHAAVSAAEKSQWKQDWMRQGQKKTVVKCAGEGELLEILKAAQREKLPTALIEDAGLTQIPAGTKTCLGIGPAPEEAVDRITGKLKLL
jgi:PTH2 family peptidyl-tRNA hydrolase